MESDCYNPLITLPLNTLSGFHCLSRLLVKFEKTLQQQHQQQQQQQQHIIFTQDCFALQVQMDSPLCLLKFCLWLLTENLRCTNFFATKQIGAKS